MKVKDFAALTKNEQERILLTEGVYISKTSFKYFDIALYRIDGNFIEVWFEKGTDNVGKIELINKKKINPYLKHLCTKNMN